MHVLDPEALVLLLLNYKQAAKALGFTEKALRDLVWKRRGPVVTKVGRRRMFYVDDLKEWIARHRAPNPPLSDPAIPLNKRGAGERPHTTPVRSFHSGQASKQNKQANKPAG